MGSEQNETFDEWAIVELMGHRRLAGRVREVTQFGGAFLRLDVPGDGDEIAATQFYAPAAVYCLTPCSEATARKVAALSRPAPVQQWELPTARPTRELDEDGDESELDDDDTDGPEPF